MHAQMVSTRPLYGERVEWHGDEADIMRHTCIVSRKRVNYYPASVTLSDCFLRCIKACANTTALSEIEEVTEMHHYCVEATSLVAM